MSEVPSTKPYLIRALYEWCVDHGFTPYVAVFVNDLVNVPMDYVNNQEIVLNIGPDACQSFHVDNDWMSFKARFAGVPREIDVPIGNVMAIYAKENGQGMSFPFEPKSQLCGVEGVDEASEKTKSGKPSLRIVK